MGKTLGIILGLAGAWILYKEVTGQSSSTGGGNSNNNNALLNPTPGATLTYSSLPGEEPNAGVEDLSTKPGYTQALAILQSSNRTSLFRSAWLLLSTWQNNIAHVSIAQIFLYNHGVTPDTIYAANSDAFTAVAQLLQEVPSPAPPSLVNVNWNNPPQAVLHFLTGYQFLVSTDISTIALAAQHENLSVDQLLLQKCFLANKTVWEYLVLVDQLVATWTQSNNNQGGGGGGLNTGGNVLSHGTGGLLHVV